jgi:CHAP domain
VTRVIVEVDAMVAAADRLTVIAQDCETVGLALRSAELPAMPAELAARYDDARAAIAARAIAIGAPIAELGAELRRRAQAADIAPDDGQAGRRLADAVGGTLAPVGTAHISAPASEVPAGAHETVGHQAAHAVHAAVASGHAPLPHVPFDNASEQQWACWMAAHAADEGLPPSAPIALALANSGMRNLDAGDQAVGFFGIAPERDIAPAGFGLGATTQPDAAWWQANPDAQLAHVLRGLSATAPATMPGDAEALGRWIAGAEPHTDPDAVTTAMSVARTLVARCRHGLDPAASHHEDADALLKLARTQLGVHETAGANTGAEVDRYLAAAGAAPGNPWCASFVTWAMRHTGHPLSGQGWAAVAQWVDAAQRHADGLSLVSAHDARPGDIVAYDWGGGADFGADGHIGILESPVGADGAFTAVEGNAGDAVAQMHRRLGEANIVFIRATGAGA